MSGDALRDRRLRFRSLRELFRLVLAGKGDLSGVKRSTSSTGGDCDPALVLPPRRALAPAAAGLCRGGSCSDVSVLVDKLLVSDSEDFAPTPPLFCLLLSRFDLDVDGLTGESSSVGACELELLLL